MTSEQELVDELYELVASFNSAKREAEKDHDLMVVLSFGGCDEDYLEVIVCRRLERSLPERAPSSS